VNRSIVIGAVASALLASQASAQAVAVPRGTSDADKLEASAEHVARMKTSLRSVLNRIEEARDEKDVVKLNCLNDKLAQMKALLRVAEQADVALHEAVAKRDAGSDAEFSKVAIARTKVEGLRAESEQCTGQLSWVVDEKTTVEVLQPDLPDQEVGATEAETGRPRRRGPPFPAPPVVRPPPASLWY
jgi:hypothetical protein